VCLDVVLNALGRQIAALHWHEIHEFFPSRIPAQTVRTACRTAARVPTQAPICSNTYRRVVAFALR
jgi:hypothetical protein